MTARLTDEEKLEKSKQECRDLIAEAHGVLRDLKTEMKTAKELVKELVGGIVSEELAVQVDALGDRIGDAMERSVAKVNAEFDKLSDTYMGREKDDPRPSIEDLMLTHDVIHFILKNAEEDKIPPGVKIDISSVPLDLAERVQGVQKVTLNGPFGLRKGEIQDNRRRAHIVVTPGENE